MFSFECLKEPGGSWISDQSRDRVGRQSVSRTDFVWECVTDQLNESSARMSGLLSGMYDESITVPGCCRWGYGASPRDGKSS